MLEAPEKLVEALVEFLDEYRSLSEPRNLVERPRRSYFVGSIDNALLSPFVETAAPWFPPNFLLSLPPVGLVVVDDFYFVGLLVVDDFWTWIRLR